MDIRKLQRVVVDALEDVKGVDIRVFNVMGVTQLFDRVIIASGTSNRQTRALADSVREKVKEAGGDVLSVEGEETGEWVLVDLGDAVVHIMQPAIRAYYDLEEIWGGKPVSLRKQEAAAARAVTDSAQARRASRTSPETAKKPAAKKRAAPAKRAGAPAAKRAKRTVGA